MKSAGGVRLGLNIDHVATLRNARGGDNPDPLRAARVAAEAGADGITAHLREDRRHIRDDDIRRIKAEISAPLNLEMAATAEMTAIATKTKPHACCLVPERRAELTTEGGLDAAGNEINLAPVVRQLAGAGIRVSLFVDPELKQIEAAARLSAHIIELHTGTYCEAWLSGDAVVAAREIERLARAAKAAASAGLEVHAGHGLDYDTAAHLVALPEIKELNIGHFLIGESIFTGLPEVIVRMRAAIEKGRARAASAETAFQD
jgi:pyridoxine 5-phosphate synthase